MIPLKVCNNWTIMLKIAIIFTLISLINSDNCFLTDDPVTELESSLMSAVSDMKSKFLNEDVIIFVGTTRAGKSTLINYLMGNHLISTSNSKYGDYKIFKADNNTSGPEIGAGPTSKTSKPSDWHSKLFPDTKLWDTPGYQDNRGGIQEVTNSFYMYLLLNSIKSLKLVLVIDINSIISNNISQLTTLVNDLLQIFGDKFEQFFPSISFIFSKVPPMVNGYKTDIDFINYTLNEKLSSYTKLNESGIFVTFLRYIITNNDRIGLFMALNHAGNITSDIDLNIFSSINKSQSILRSDFKYVSSGVSDSSLLCLKSIQGQLLRNLQNLSMKDDFYNIINSKTIVSDELAKNKNMTALNVIQSDLNFIKLLLNYKLKNDDLYENIQILCIFDYRMMEIVNESKLLLKIKIVEFLSSLLDSNIFVNYEKSIKNFINSLLTSIKNVSSHNAMLINDFNLNNTTKSTGKRRGISLIYMLFTELMGTFIFSIIKFFFSSTVIM